MYAEPNWGMSNIKRHKDCPFRTKLANCDAVGGFCTSVNETICEGIHKALNMVMEALQERPQGKWIRRSSVGNWECPLCGSDVIATEQKFANYNYCPNCGADMREGAENE